MESIAEYKKFSLLLSELKTTDDGIIEHLVIETISNMNTHPNIPTYEFYL